MPPLFDLILDLGELDTELIEAIDADASWRQGLMFHPRSPQGVVQLDASDQPRSGLGRQSLTSTQGWTGGVVVVLAMVGFLNALSSLPGAELGLFQQLNQELGALCQEPPARAVKVCDLHARLVNR